MIRVKERAVADKNLISDIAHNLRVSEKFAEILISCGCNSVEKAYAFLNPSLKDLYDPFLMKDMDKSSNVVLIYFSTSSIFISLAISSLASVSDMLYLMQYSLTIAKSYFFIFHTLVIKIPPYYYMCVDYCTYIITKNARNLISLRTLIIKLLI